VWNKKGRREVGDWSLKPSFQLTPGCSMKLLYTPVDLLSSLSSQALVFNLS